MEIEFLGTWSSHMKKGARNSSILLDKKTVLDFGPHTLESILEHDVDPAGIERVLISHLHLDHYLGLLELLWYRGSRKINEPLQVMGPRGIRETTEKMLQMVKTPQEPDYEISVEFVESKKLDFIEVYDGNHIIPDNVYRLNYDDWVIVYTGDTAYSSEVVRAAEESDILIHEMTYTDGEKRIAEHWKHSTYSSVIRTFDESGAKTLIPIHLTEGTYNQISRSKNTPANVVLPDATLKLKVIS